MANSKLAAPRFDPRGRHFSILNNLCPFAVPPPSLAMLRYGNLDEQPTAPEALSGKPSKSLAEYYDKVVEFLRGQIIGRDQRIPIPFDGSTRKIVYADYTASGRGLQCIENFITHKVLPVYGNTHSIASATARQTTFYRSEAREKVRAYFNANHQDSVIFCGAGATGAASKFLEILWKSRGFDTQGEDEDEDERKYFTQDRWGGCECTLCGVRLKNESVYRSHVKTAMHTEKIIATAATAKKRRSRRRAVLIVDPVNHHSSTLPFREILPHFPIIKGGSASVTGSQYKVSGVVDDSVDNVFETELKELPLDPVTGSVDITALEETLKEIAHFNELTSTDTTAVPIVVLSACSNVTGVMLDIPSVSTLIHSYNGIACWDLAAANSKIKIDMNPVSHPQGYIDFAFVSPHKLLGGPGSSGLLLCKKKHQTNVVPAVCGGGVVFYVSPVAHSYIQNHEEREEAGTPDILGCIRAGAVYHLHSMLDHDRIADTERRMARELTERLSECSKIHILGPKDRSNCGGIISFNILYNEDEQSKRGLYLHYNFVNAVLNDVFGVQGRGGCACAGPYAHSLLGINNDMATRFEKSLRKSGCEVIRPGFMRVGVHYSMTDEELDVLAGSILWVAENAWKLLGAYTFSTSTGEWHHQLDRRERNRQWLSTDLGWSRILGDTGVTNGVTVVPAAVDDDSIEGLIKRADKIVENAYSAGQVPFSAVKCPLLDPELADLIWFALPTDCKWSMEGVVGEPKPKICTDPNVPLFKGVVEGKLPRRPTESIFNSSIWSKSEEERKLIIASHSTPQQEEVRREGPTDLASPHVELHPSGFPQTSITPVVSKKLRLLTGTAVRDFQMINEGDKILVGLSGGKDSLTMLHLLLAMRKRSPVKFTVGAATVDPQTPEYSPEPLKRYMEALGVEYHFLSKPLIEMAKNSLDPKKPSLCSFCARMKRGMLYSCMREFGYTSLALGQHLDDLAESFVMSAFHNGTLRTMKANYFVQQGDIRVIRPLVYCREKQLAEFATENSLPVISDNCPACFATPKERHRVKVLLSEQEFDYPRLFNSLLSTMKPLMAIRNAGKASDIAKGKISGDEKMSTVRSTSDEDTDQAAEECIMSCNIGGACPLPKK